MLSVKVYDVNGENEAFDGKMKSEEYYNSARHTHTQF